MTTKYKAGDIIKWKYDNETFYALLSKCDNENGFNSVSGLWYNGDSFEIIREWTGLYDRERTKIQYKDLPDNVRIEFLKYKIGLI